MSIPDTKIFSKNVIQSSSFAWFTSYCIFGLIDHSRVEISHSTFSGFLANAVCLKRAQYRKHKVYEFTKIHHKTEPVHIRSCIFRDYSIQEDKGGALYLEVPLRCEDCVFHNIQAKTGPAFYTTEDMSMRRTVIHGCTSDRSGGFEIQAENKGMSEITGCAFSSLLTWIFGIFYRSGHERLLFSNSNSSSTCVRGYVALFESCSPGLVLKNSMFVDSYAHALNGGILLRKIETADISHCVFYNSTQTQRHNQSGVVLLMLECIGSLVISHTIFSTDVKAGSHMINVASISPVYIEKCTFSCIRSQAVHTIGSAATVVDSTFSHRAKKVYITFSLNYHKVVTKPRYIHILVLFLLSLSLGYLFSTYLVPKETLTI